MARDGHRPTLARTFWGSSHEPLGVGVGGPGKNLLHGAEFDDAAAMCEMAADGAGAAPLPAPMLPSAVKRYGLRMLPLRTGIHEELFVVTAERQFAHEGVRILARVAGEAA